MNAPQQGRGISSKPYHQRNVMAGPAAFGSFCADLLSTYPQNNWVISVSKECTTVAERIGHVRVDSPGTLSRRESVAVYFVSGACTLKSPQQEAQREDLSAIDPRIQGAFRTLTSERALEILLVTRPERSCDPLLPALEALGHRVVLVRSNRQALENFYLQAFDLVICDHGSEGNACDEFAAHLRTLDPRQRVLSMDFAQTPF